MGNKLYVGNISFQADEKGLEEVFGQYGAVSSVKIITDFQTGRSRGFGFVEMETQEEAQKCIENLDGKDVQGRNIRVSIAKDRNDQGNRSGGGGRSFNNRW